MKSLSCISLSIHLVFSSHITHSVRAVIDYVTVYRAHSSSDKEEGCDIPFRTVPLYAPLQADNSVTGGVVHHFALWTLKSVSVSAAARTKRRADVFTMTGMLWHSAQTSLPNTISSTQLRSACMWPRSLLQGLRRIVYVSNKLRVRLHRIFTNVPVFVFVSSSLET